MYTCVYICIFTGIIVISEPDDVCVCEGKSTTFTCIWNGNIRDNIQWYRYIKDTNSIISINSDGENITISNHTGNTINSSLTITEAVKSYAGYYWVRLSSGDFCNVSLTVLSSMWIPLVIIIPEMVIVWYLANFVNQC